MRENYEEVPRPLLPSRGDDLVHPDSNQRPEVERLRGDYVGQLDIYHPLTQCRSIGYLPSFDTM